MPKYVTKSVEFGGGRSFLSPELTRDDGQEDFANSWYSGRWVGGMVTLRYVINNIGALGFGNNTVIHDFGGIPGGATALGHMLIFDAVVVSRITAATGSYNVNLGGQFSGSRSNIITGTTRAAALTPIAYTDEANASYYPAAHAGRGGITLESQELGIRWFGTGLTFLVPTSRIVVVIAAYVFPNQLEAGA